MTALAFVDLETTGLNPLRHEPWEVGLVLRGDDGRDEEYLWQLPVDGGRADPVALTIGKFYERRWGAEKILGPVNGKRQEEGKERRVHSDFVPRWAKRFAELTHGAVFVGANPTFDDAFLRPLLRANGACPGWHYRLVCVESLAVGYLNGIDVYQHGVERPPVPWKGVSDLAERLGIAVDEETKHSALADARKARDVYDRVMGTPR